MMIFFFKKKNSKTQVFIVIACMECDIILPSECGPWEYKVGMSGAQSESKSPCVGFVHPGVLLSYLRTKAACLVMFWII
jgi:hypothetical protein